MLFPRGLGDLVVAAIAAVALDSVVADPGTVAVVFRVTAKLATTRELSISRLCTKLLILSFLDPNSSCSLSQQKSGAYTLCRACLANREPGVFSSF